MEIKDIRSYYEESDSDEEIRKQALRTAVYLLQKTKDLNNELKIMKCSPIRSYHIYRNAHLKTQLKIVLVCAKAGTVSVLDAADILGLPEEKVREMIDDNSKIEEYYEDAKMPKDTERTLHAVYQYILKFIELRDILDRTVNLVERGELTVANAADIVGLGADEYADYVRSIYGTSL